MLVEAHHQDAFVPGHYIFRTVAVVYVEVDDRDPLQAVALERVLGSDRHVVEKAETHCMVAAGMVAGRAYGAEGVFQFTRDDRVGRGQRQAGGA